LALELHASVVVKHAPLFASLSSRLTPTAPFTTRSIPRLKSVAAGFTFEEGRGAAGRQEKRRTLSSDAESLSGAATTLLSLHGSTIVAMAVTARQVVAAAGAGQGTACSSLHIVKLADYSVESFNLQGESHLLSCNVRDGSEKGEGNITD
jgi:hypothetical protein